MAVGTVLIINGDREAREDLVRDFARGGIRGSACGGLAEAQDLMREQRFECAIIDVAMEDGDGLDAVVELRRTVPALPIVVTAAENTRELEGRVRALDVLYYYVQGFDREELLEAVGRALGGPGRPAVQRKILVIDDDPDYQAAVRTMLESGGFAVIAAYTKSEGMEKVIEEAPDLVILDIMMEHMTDGFHFLYELRSDPRSKRVPVLAVTAVSERTGFDFAPKRDGDYFPADDYIAKPVKVDDLLSRVRALLERGT
jgi:DNA-binding response OmpR family regulator